ncbi:MAG: sigma-70 family RNA polymerase sigma factor [Pirellulales bacterium]
MALSEIDRKLLQRCLARKPRAWEDFVDRFMGLVVHVINHSVQARSIRLSPEDRDDLVAQVFLTFVRDDFAILRHFRGESSLATYLTVVARRVVVRELLKHKAIATLSDAAAGQLSEGNGKSDAEQRISDREEVDRLLQELNEVEAEIVRLYHLDGLSYEQISHALNVPENSIGPTLSRARTKMRRAGADSAAG